MTDEDPEGTPTSEELRAPEVQEVSPDVTEVQQPSVSEAGITEERLVEILAERDEANARAAQSAKDRAISRNAKDIAAILARFDELGGDEPAANTLVREADQQALLDKVAALEAQISKGLVAAAAPTATTPWQSEWDVTAQKILDAAEAQGIAMSNEEVNQVAFNNGIAFETKADAEAALTAAIVAKAKGDSIPVSVVSTEGGEVAHTPEPTAPKSFRQQFDELNAAPRSPENDKALRDLLNKKWEDADEDARRAKARAAAEAAGLTLAE